MLLIRFLTLPPLQVHIQKGTIPPNIFAKIDTNGDKQISKDEMANFILETGIYFYY